MALACTPADDAPATADAAVPCTRNTCPTGCCDADGACQRADDDQQCGTDGRACVACGPDAACFAGACILPFTDAADCTPESCDGCCSGNRCVTSISDTYCGVGGDACTLCAFWEQCVDGACVLDDTRCGPHNCQGCCIDGYTCLEQPTVEFCGSGGLVCENCPEGGYLRCEDGLCVR